MRYPKLLISILLKLLSFTKGEKRQEEVLPAKRLEEVLPAKFIDDEKYSFERLLVKILCSKFHTNVPNINKLDLRDNPYLQKYYEDLLGLRSFLDENIDRVSPVLFRGRRSYTMKERPKGPGPD